MLGFFFFLDGKGGEVWGFVWGGLVLCALWLWGIRGFLWGVAGFQAVGGGGGGGGGGLSGALRGLFVWIIEVCARMHRMHRILRCRGGGGRAEERRVGKVCGGRWGAYH